MIDNEFCVEGPVNDAEPKRITLPKGGANGHQKEQKKPKKCQYEGCDAFYMGTGFSKYCDEHRKREYHKPSKNDKLTIDHNVKYEHSNKDSVLTTFVCALDGCGKTFEIKILPNTFIYPKYCPEHRNEHKRNMFLKGGNKCCGL
jgi:hypothetical protein